MAKPGLVTVRVRGIYATALSVLLHEKGFLLSDVTEIVRSRLGIPASTSPPNVTVKSLEEDPDRVLVIGYPWDAGLEVLNTLVESLAFVALRSGPLGINTVVDARSIGDCKLELPGGVIGELDSKECPPKDSMVRATVVRESLEPQARPLLREGVRLVGDYTIVSHPGSGVSFSEHVRDPTLRAELLATLEGRIDTSLFHVRFRSSSKMESVSRIVAEAEELASRARELWDKGPGKEPVIVSRGEYIALVYVSSRAKELLDSYRSKVAPTVKHHHSLKASGREESGLVDFVEEALKNKHCVDEAGTSILYHVSSRLGRVSIEQRYPDGSRISLGPFSLESRSVLGGHLRLELKRVFRTRGEYDGLGVEKNPGDVGKTTVSTGSWSVTHEYYTSDGRLLGVYVNINTPPEIGFKGIRYLDLYIDVVKRPGEKAEIIDADKLEESYREGLVTRKLYEKALEEAERAARRISSEYP
ncbi:MAG: DUF402 domain-containing protein [Desulfurococcales archaeon]|nr:DUF402 domain-containing protein [Desulfurococcales archaeon]